MAECRIDFPDSDVPSLRVDPGVPLCELLTSTNSPILFGCRSGICGTCLIEVIEGKDATSPVDPDERESLDLYAPDTPAARLACQVRLSGPVAIRKIEPV